MILILEWKGWKGIINAEINGSIINAHCRNIKMIDKSF